jgi:hypothetical protein
VFDDAPTAEPAAHPVHRRQRLLGRERRIHRDRRRAAQVAMPTGFDLGLAEIAPNRTGAAANAFEHAVKLARLAHLHLPHLVGQFAGFDPPQRPVQVGGAIEGDALGQFTVAARAADLLPIGLDRRRRIGVDDEADVGFIDTHAEGDGRHHHRLVRLQEVGQAFGADLLVQAGVIGDGRHAGGDQFGGDLVGAVARAGIDHAGAAGPSGDQLDHPLAPAALLALGRQHQFGPGEAVDEFGGVL